MTLSKQDNELFAGSVIATLEDLENKAQNQKSLSTEVLAEIRAAGRLTSEKSSSVPSVNFRQRLSLIILFHFHNTQPIPDMLCIPNDYLLHE